MINAKEIVRILPALRMMLSTSNIKVARICTDNDMLQLISSESKFFSHITHLDIPEIKNRILYVTQASAEQTLTQCKEKIEDLLNQKKELPNVLALQGLGIVTVGESFKETDIILNSIKSKTSEPIHISNIPKRKVENKTIIITGGAQGFGGGIAESLFEEGANVVIADLNETKGNELAMRINKPNASNKAICIKTDVTNAESVQNLIRETVKTFGGFDAFISNAGILHAGSLDEMNMETFELVTKVNYSGYFLCTKYASEVLKLQSLYRKDYYSDIIQINSKSGLKGSNKNFAYAGGKFGGIGLTQSFALELMPYRIKVNSICPGNFFEGPLWSDPNNGLFVQYLKAGKVPGAKTIDDVKAHYEKQVPAGRGCHVKDVMKAIYYVMDQEYETGQAVPVTGGQEMLN